MSQVVIEGFRLSPQQKRLWRLQGDSRAYKTQCLILLQGHLDKADLRRAIQAVVNQHEILRTSFQSLPGLKIPVQVADEKPIFTWCEMDFTSVESCAQECRLDELVKEERDAPADFQQRALTRCCLITLSEQKHTLLITLPALCADAASLKNLISEMAHYYRIGQSEALPDDDSVQYADFAEWFYELLASEEGIEGKAYWNRQTIPTHTPSLPMANKSDEATSFASACLSVSVDADLARRIEVVAKAYETSDAVLLLTCWKTLLWRITQESDIVVWQYEEGRRISALTSALGLFAAYLPLRTRFEPSLRFNDMLRLVDESAKQAYRHQEYFSWNESGDGNVESFPSHCFEFHQWPVEQEFENLLLSVEKLYSCVDRFRLKLTCFRRKDSIGLEVHYDSASYAADDIHRLIEEFLTLLESVLKRPDITVLEADVLGEGERQALLVEWNDTRAEFAPKATLHERFEAQVERSPDAIAVVYGDEHLTYQALNRRANQLAHYLRRLGVGPESVVALILNRSIDMFVGLLGAMKAGAAYLPLDAGQPQSRLAFMLEDAQVAVLLTHEDLKTKFADVVNQTLCLDSDCRFIASESDANPETAVAAENLAYVIYTSGSTGKPKGVMIQHGSVVNLYLALQKAIYQSYQSSLRVSLNAPLAFDSSVKQVIQLLSGHCICLVPEDVRPDGQELLSFLNRQRLDVFDCTPSQLKILLASGLDEMPEASPALALVGGEAIDEATWSALAKNRWTDFYNVYGPTECTVDASVCPVNAAPPLPTIGRAIANTRLYVLDNQGQPLPIGVTGELHIGGAGVARGYVCRPEGTAEKFVPDRFSEEPGARIYKTGDLARFRPEGNLEFFGRRDQQIKIRGSRIELGEIETALQDHPAIRAAVVIPWEDESIEMRLVAYVVPKSDKQLPFKKAFYIKGQESEKLEENNCAPEPVEQSLSTAELRSFLKERLPDYMVPSVFIALSDLPLTRNGKIDRLALPGPDQALEESTDNSMAPRTPIEAIVAGFWTEILGIENIGINDNFFELGGHSLLATQLFSRLRKALQVEILLRTLFEAPTVSGLAARLETAIRDGQELPAPPIQTSQRDGFLPLSYAQQRLWFIDQLEPGNPFYVTPRAIRLRGALNLKALEQTIGEILNRHEVLRTTFPQVDGSPVQKIAPVQAFTLAMVDLRTLSEIEREAEARRLVKEQAKQPFDLSRNRLLRVKVICLGDQEHVVLFTLHHIVTDAWSTGILVREITKLYASFLNGEASPLPELPIQYTDFAHWQRQWLQGDVLEKHLAYWREQLRDCPPLLELPIDWPRPATQTFRGAYYRYVFPASLSQELKALSRRQGVTLFMTLLAAFKALLYHYSGQEDIVVGTNVANRNWAETEGLIGFFINMLTLRTDLSGNPSFTELLKRTREVSLGAYAHQDVPFEKLVEELKPERSLSHTPLFQVVLSLQNAPDSTLELPGLSTDLIAGASGTAKFDLVVNLSESEMGLVGSYEYNRDLFEPATIIRMVSQFERLLSSVVAHPDTSLNDLELLSEEEKVLLERPISIDELSGNFSL
jgi:amino acid adenylation domain-containing protein